MSNDKYREILRQAKDDFWKLKAEVAEWQKRQAELEKQLVGLREIIVATSRMLGEDFVEEDELGLTDAIRQVYRTTGFPMSPVGVEKQLAKIGYDLSKYETDASAKASIHKVVSRLAESGELKPAGVNRVGRQLWKWAGKGAAKRVPFVAPPPPPPVSERKKE